MESVDRNRGLSLNARIRNLEELTRMDNIMLLKEKIKLKRQFLNYIENCRNYENLTRGKLEAHNAEAADLIGRFEKKPDKNLENKIKIIRRKMKKTEIKLNSVKRKYLKFEQSIFEGQQSLEIAETELSNMEMSNEQNYHISELVPQPPALETHSDFSKKEMSGNLIVLTGNSLVSPKEPGTASPGKPRETYASGSNFKNFADRATGMDSAAYTSAACKSVNYPLLNQLKPPGKKQNWPHVFPSTSVSGTPKQQSSSTFNYSKSSMQFAQLSAAQGHTQNKSETNSSAALSSEACQVSTEFRYLAQGSTTTTSSTQDAMASCVFSGQGQNIPLGQDSIQRNTPLGNNVACLPPANSTLPNWNPEKFSFLRYPPPPLLHDTRLGPMPKNYYF